MLCGQAMERPARQPAHCSLVSMQSALLHTAAANRVADPESLCVHVQLYLNYKMKSVAHLPWRQMTYKFLNTIIDDLFAFVIKMPTLHRLSVFRDDIVFLILMYQRWIYRVDKKRANEFG